ncbi:MAG: RNA polymerase sigma factor, partial [Terriglobales bacterium]
MAASDIPDARPVTDSKDDTSASNPAPDETQLSPPHGVSTNVSSLAIDRGPLGRGLVNLAGATPPSPDAMPKPMVNADDPVSDVDVMLRVKTGDESAFAYLVQKYRRPMVGFMYRMCHNPSTAEELAQEDFLRVYRSRTS